MAATPNIFIKINSIKGSSTVKGFEGQIEALAFGFSGNLPTIGQASTAAETHGHVQISDFSITKLPDVSSPYLFANMCGGKRMQEDIEINVNKILDTKSQTFYNFKLTGALVTSFSSNGSGDMPMESITLNFTKVVFGYADEAQGQLKAPVNKGWDAVASTPI
jgi:type VI secretion system secreted protein Hcp